MTYILMIWTVVAMAGDRHYQAKAMDWRPIGEFHLEEGRMNKKTAREMCEEAARQLGLKIENYRCVRSK
jgi:hypothetical protein